MAKIGLLAGEGSLPIVFSRYAKAKGDVVIAFGLKGITSPELEANVAKMHWLEWKDLKKALMLLAMERLGKIVMLGKIKKEDILKDASKIGGKTADMLKDKKDYAILNEAAKLLSKIGIQVMDSTTYLKELMPSKGTLTRREPTAKEWEDIDYGRDVAKAMAGFDIGQTVVVKDKAVIALESAEGTDETIKRAGILAKDGFVVVKVARPNQDMRFDVPLVGISTVQTVIDSGGKVLAIESDKMLMMDKDESVKLADENGLSMLAI